MKLRRLDLIAFGPFTDHGLDLGSGDGLHLVYGPNEAGKSSTLRALKNLLFGIPHNSADDFIHPYAKMRIGATLADSDAQEWKVVRRKGTKNTLLDALTEEAVDERTWTRLLGGIPQALFETLFAIDHQELVEGGQAILNGSGDVGQILFAAGAGIGGLRRVLDGLQAEAEELFKPSGRNPRINDALTKLRQARNDLRNCQTLPAVWQEHQRALQAAQAELAQIESQLDAVRREKSRFGRISEALPLAAKRRPLVQQLAALSAVPVLRPEFAEDHRQALLDLRTSQAAFETAREARAEIDREIQQLYLPEFMIDERDVDHLQESLGSYRKAQKDLPALQAAGEHLQAEGAAILRLVRPGMRTEDAEQLRLTKSELAQLQRLGKRHEALLLELDKARAEEREAAVRLQAAQERLMELPPAQPIEPLHEAIQRWQAQGDLESQLAGRLAELAEAEQQAALQLARLPRWSGGLEELVRLQFPALEHIEDFEDRLHAKADAVADLRSQNSTVEADQRSCQGRMRQLEMEGQVPSEDALAQARRTRSEGWRLVVRAWREGEPQASELDEFLSQTGVQGADLARAYEHTVESADLLADRLRREAARVSALAQLRSDLQASDERLEKLAQALEAAEAEERQSWAAWRAAWAGSGVDPGSPREMRSWRHAQEALCGQADAIRTRRAAVTALEQRIAQGKAELAKFLVQTGSREIGAGDSLAARIAWGLSVVKTMEAQAASRQQFRGEVQEFTTKLALGRQSVQQAEQKLAGWQEQWAREVRPLGLSSESTPTQADETLSQLQEALDKLKQAADKAERVEAIRRDAEQFAEDVRRLSEQAAPGPVHLPLEPQVEQLLARLRTAIESRRKHQALKERAARQKNALEEAERQIRLTSSCIKQLCEEAGVADPADLDEAVRLSSQAVALRAAIENVDEQLRLLSGGSPVEAFLLEVEAADADALPVAIAGLAEQADVLEARRQSLSEKIGGAKLEISKIDGNARAAERVQELQGLIARVEADAECYVRLRLASVMLREGIQRYRERNEGPVLRRASQLFADLTLGSFEGLRPDYNDRDEAVLVGIRAGTREAVPVQHCMSDGAADQLYLALRLAGLEEFLKTSEPLPLIVDDILVNFDDHRSIAALKALAEFSEQTQVIFFTHHQHLLKLARDNVPDGLLSLHELRGRAPAAAIA